MEVNFSLAGFVCLVVLNPRVVSQQRILGFFFFFFS